MFAIDRLKAVAVLAAGCMFLAGCSGTPEETPASPTTGSPSAAASPSTSASAEASPSATPSQLPNLDDVKVSGKFGGTPTVTGPWPFVVDKTEVKVLHEGTGPAAGKNASLLVDYHGVVARTGQIFQSSFKQGSPAMLNLGGVIKGFETGLMGKKAGSRVLIVIPGSEGYDASGGLPQAGINVGDTLIFVVDILDVALSGPSGDKVTPPTGLPKVTDADGKAVIKIGDAKKPKKLVSQDLIVGKGKKVAANDLIVVHFTEIAWSTGKVVAESYAPGGKGAELSKLIPGWRDGLVGKTVGSRVLLVIPPSMAYPEGNDSPKIAPDETLVAVVDILMRQPAKG